MLAAIFHGYLKPRRAETVLLGENRCLYNYKLCCKAVFDFKIHLTRSKVTRTSFLQSPAADETDYVEYVHVI